MHKCCFIPWPYRNGGWIEMTATNINHMERLAQTKEELEHWACKYADYLVYYKHAEFMHYPNLDYIESVMEENRAALVEWAIEFNKAWEVV
jgi:hypothetical protein